LQDVPLILGVDEAETGEQAVGIARSLRPDVILLDPVPPDMLLKEAVRRLRAVSPESRIVIFTSRLTPSRRAEAISLGVSGILGKDVTPARLIEAIRSAKAGEFAEDPASSEILKQAAQRVNGTPLTAREYEIIQRAALGESNAEIAKAIFLAPTTVKSYLQSALRKLDARNRAEAVFKLSEMHIL
jgi:DNA-binding NarL/FixJ family response regulator